MKIAFSNLEAFSDFEVAQGARHCGSIATAVLLHLAI
jgi:hypothetical protein